MNLVAAEGSRGICPAEPVRGRLATRHSARAAPALAAGLLLLWPAGSWAAPAAAAAPAQAAPIPMDQIGAVAGKQYQGEG
jgi:hypothetical protein